MGWFHGQHKQIYGATAFGILTPEYQSYLDAIRDIRVQYIESDNAEEFKTNMNSLSRLYVGKTSTKSLLPPGTSNESANIRYTFNKVALSNSIADKRGIDVSSFTIISVTSNSILTFNQCTHIMAEEQHGDMMDYMTAYGRDVLIHRLTGQLYSYTVNAVESPYAQYKDNPEGTNDGVYQGTFKERVSIGWLEYTLTSLREGTVRSFKVHAIDYYLKDLQLIYLDDVERWVVDHVNSVTLLYTIAVTRDNSYPNSVDLFISNTTPVRYVQSNDVVEFEPFVQVKSEKYGDLTEDVKDANAEASEESQSALDENGSDIEAFDDSHEYSTPEPDHTETTRILKYFGIKGDSLQQAIATGTIQDLRIGFGASIVPDNHQEIKYLYDFFSQYSSDAWSPSTDVMNLQESTYLTVFRYLFTNREERYYQQGNSRVVLRSGNGSDRMSMLIEFQVQEKIRHGRVADAPTEWLVKVDSGVAVVGEYFKDLLMSKYLAIQTDDFPFYNEYRQQEYPTFTAGANTNILILDFLEKELDLLSKTGDSTHLYGHVNHSYRYNAIKDIVDELPPFAFINKRVNEVIPVSCEYVHQVEDKLWYDLRYDNEGTDIQFLFIRNVTENTKLPNEGSYAIRTVDPSTTVSEYTSDSTDVPNFMHNEYDRYLNRRLYIQNDTSITTLDSTREHSLTVIYSKQVSPNIYHEIHVSRLDLYYGINGFGTKTRLNNDNKGTIRIPLTLGYLSKNSGNAISSKLMYERMLTGFAFSHSDVYIHWYEKPEIMSIIEIASIVASIYSLGASATFMSALGKLALSVLASEAGSYIQDHVGGTLGTILGVVAVMAVQTVGTGADLGTILGSKDLWVKTADTYLQMSSSQAQKEYEEFSRSSDKTMADIQDKMNDVKYAGQLIDANSRRYTADTVFTESTSLGNIDIIDTELYHNFDLRSTIPDELFEVDYIMDKLLTN